MSGFSKNILIKGMKAGLPIGLGYFAVSFSLGITAHNAGLTVMQGIVMSLLNNASAGQYAGIAAIKAGTPILELALLILVANARYLLMSCALSQKIGAGTHMAHRLFIGFDITDEIFGLNIAQPTPLNPFYTYGAYITTMPLWAGGTALGIIAGNILPQNVVYALSASIFGMFIAVVVPPARKDKNIFIVVLASLLISGLTSLIPWFSSLSESMRVIILTVVISVGAAIVFPRPQEKAEEVSAPTDAADGKAADSPVCHSAIKAFRKKLSKKPKEVKAV